MVLKKLLNGIKSLFKAKHPRSRQVYAITGGKYLGEFFVYINQSEREINFLSIPKMEKRHVTKEKFYFGLTNKIVDPVEKIPPEVYELCKEEYNNINI